MNTATPLGQISQLGKGCILAATRFTVIGWKKTFESKPNAPRSWIAHIYEIEDNGFRSEAKFWNRDLDEINGFIGNQIEVEAASNKGKACGLEVGEDNRQNPQLSISENCAISFIDGGRQYQRPAPHQQRQQHTQQQYRGESEPPQHSYQSQPAPQQQRNYQAPNQAQQRPTPQQQNRPRAPLGITVGMAINNAVKLITDIAQPSDEYLDSLDFSRDLHRIASDILRVSSLLETGKLAPPVKDRRGQPQQQSAPQQSQRQEPQQTQRPAPQPAKTDNFDESPFVDGLEGDDIAF